MWDILVILFMLAIVIAIGWIGYAIGFAIGGPVGGVIGCVIALGGSRALR